MRILLFVTAFLILGPIVALVYANGWMNAGRDGPQLPRDELLLAVSPPVALMHSTQQYRMESSCATAEFLRSTVLEDTATPNTEFLADFVAGIANECRLMQVAAEETEPLYREIGESGRLPAETYAFGLFVYDPNLKGEFAGYAEETVGLFADPSACDRVETLARELGLPTRKCGLWEESDLL